MWHAQHTLETTTQPESIWRCWTNVQGWPEWDESLASATLQGPMAPGAAGMINYRSGKRLAFRMVECVEGRRISFLGRVLGTNLTFVYSLEPSSMGTKLTHSVEARGPFSWFLGRSLREGLPVAARKLAHLAEKV